jgi:hypothetical protein
MAMIANDVDRFDDIGMLEGGSDAKFCGDFLLVLPLRLTGALGPKLLYGKDVAAVFVAGFDETYCTASTGTQNATPLAIFLAKVSLGSLGKGIDGMWTRGSVGTRRRMTSIRTV